MYDIYVVLQNTPGSLAALGQCLGRHQVGLEGGGVFTADNQCHAHFLVVDGPKAKQILETQGFEVRGLYQPLIRKLKQERPGELGEICATLAQHGVNILIQYSDHANQLILVTDNAKVAAKVTEQWAVLTEF